MPTSEEITKWKGKILERYENYLKTSFYFKDADLRKSFEQALSKDSLSKGPFPEPPHQFKSGCRADELANELFPDNSKDLLPALLLNGGHRPLHSHQEKAIRLVCQKQNNAVVATGTASGKTESFLYPILFELYRQHLGGTLNQPGVRAMILYPMNALANDQRRRLIEICDELKKFDSGFQPSFGQYIGETPENKSDKWRNAKARADEPLTGEVIYRDEMRKNPPHILLTNYSMLEYLLIRPDDSPLFQNGEHWQFIVLDEAHQYRGVRGMEMGMLLRRLKQRLREDGRRRGPFRCIATSATLSSGDTEKDKAAVAAFASALFSEEFSNENIVFHEKIKSTESQNPQRFHLFMRALEGAFLIHRDGKDEVRLNRGGDGGKPIEIALCRECGQHYYVGRNDNGVLHEANRDPSGEDFLVEFYLPLPNGNGPGNTWLCRNCGEIGEGELECECNAGIKVRPCESHSDYPDRIKKCAVCEYVGAGDPVQEIVHGADGPNSVIATALHGLLSDDKRKSQISGDKPKSKILSFTDSRQEAAFFAWYAGDSYNQMRDRNLILRSIRPKENSPDSLSLDGLANRLDKTLEETGLYAESATLTDRKRTSLEVVCREMLTDKTRISLSGVGLMKWLVEIPQKLEFPPLMFEPPWNFDRKEAHDLVSFLLDNLRIRRAVNLPEGRDTPQWSAVAPPRRPQMAVRNYNGSGYTFAWTNLTQATFIKHFLFRLLRGSELSDRDKKEQKELGERLMDEIWDAIQSHSHEADDRDEILIPVSGADFRLNPRWLRVQFASLDDTYECDTCATTSVYNIRGICIRHRCQGNLKQANAERLSKNHYRILYEDAEMPVKFVAEEHTAQVNSDEARKRQEKFKNGGIHLLSSSTTFEVGVDLGDLETVFMRNVPPEPFNYTQRAGRAGRRGTPGLALTYCRRSPHDLYHYQDPEERVLRGETRAPNLHLLNAKIILRHMTAVALSAYFRAGDNAARFKKMEYFIGGDWDNPRAAADLRAFCNQNGALEKTLHAIVPPEMHGEVGLSGDGGWVQAVIGEHTDGGLIDAEQSMCEDYQHLDKLWIEISRDRGRDAGKLRTRLETRMNTITDEKPLNFLSRKAVIPKYGFPVDVVELDVRMSGSHDATKVNLQRDLAQAIAEYAPGSKVVANKKEWESFGVKVMHDKALPVKRYKPDWERTFKSWPEYDKNAPPGSRKYLRPIFGFAVPLKEPREPSGRARRLYTTRPFFEEFLKKDHPPIADVLGIKITKASPAKMVVLCEGKNGGGFYICRACGAGYVAPKKTHQNPEGQDCRKGTPEEFVLGHEFVTSAVQMPFPSIHNKETALSLAYAILLGTAQALDVPDGDLNVTITGLSDSPGFAIVLYDNVPGGAGLVDNLENPEVLRNALEQARERVNGGCGCDESCYGCLRSYRNQFAHPDLRRNDAYNILNEILNSENTDSE